MEKYIHRIVTDIKFLYPCFAHGESLSSQEMLITTETKLTSLYPVKRSVKGMTPVGEDYWGRYTFKDEKEQFYCELDGELYFKGNDIEGEPHYPVKKVIEYDFPLLDPEVAEIKTCIEKVKKHIGEQTELKVVDVKTSLQEDRANPTKSKIICFYRLELKTSPE